MVWLLPLAAGLPWALSVAYWLIASALIASLQLLWLWAHRYGPSGSPVLALVREMMLYGKAKEACSPRQNVPKAWFGHFYVLGCIWHFVLCWLLLDGLWCWTGPHEAHCERHPPLLALLIAPPGSASSSSLAGWLPAAPPGGYAAAGSDEIANVCLGLLLYGVHVWRRLSEDCPLSALFLPRRHSHSAPPPSTAQMHLAHYLFGMSFYIAAPLTLIADPVVLLTLAGHLGAAPAETALARGLARGLVRVHNHFRTTDYVFPVNRSK